MATLRRWFFVWLALVLCVGRLVAASADDRAYLDAVKPFQDTVWDNAEAQLAQFIEKYPQSPHLPEAVLLQARSQIIQRKFEQAIALLTTRQGEADKLADEYLYWRGEAHFQNASYEAAADAFGKLASGFPTSGRRLEASVREAAAWAKLGQWSRVAELLKKSDGAFQQATKASPDSEFGVRGHLMLAEAELAQKRYAEAEAALQPLATSKLKPELDWQRQYLLCRIQLGSGKTNDALASSTNLIALAQASGRRDFVAESLAFRAGIFEQTEKLDEARAAYELNLGADVPIERQREAFLKIAELALTQNQLAEAIQRFEKSLVQFTNSPITDVVLLTLGEVYLKLHLVRAQTNATDTAAVSHALTNLNRLVNGFPNSAFVGKAQLDRGWCYWSYWIINKTSENLQASVEAFKTAAARLPPSEDLAVARFKLADGLFALKDFSGALTNYRGALQAAAELPRVREALTTQALYQMLKASLALKDLAGASDAMRKILESYPHRIEADRSVLLVGQGYAEAEMPDQARALFEEFGKLFPESELRPEVELLIAQARYQKADWPAAIGEYEAWLDRFKTNRLRPQAEFYRALANFRAGNETNALSLLTNFVAQYATNDLAPLAQWWVADFYWRLGDVHYLDAETNYKLLFQKWPKSELAYPARMMAGRAAILRQSYENAIDHFTNLTSNPNCPTGLIIQATFAYGGALMLRNSSETNNPGSDLKEAIRVFVTIYERYPATEHAALAWGEIGNCYLQLGAQDARNYDSASNAYLQVASSPHAGVAARSQAKVGLALVAEKQSEPKSGAEKVALLKLARDQYLDVFYEANLRDGETADLFWVREAGLGAARVVESAPFQEWSQAVKFYERLLKLLPQMKATWEKKIANAREQERLNRKKDERGV